MWGEGAFTSTRVRPQYLRVNFGIGAAFINETVRGILEREELGTKKQKAVAEDGSNQTWFAWLQQPEMGMYARDCRLRRKVAQR